MGREAIIAALRAHEPELRRAGVTALSVFGSVARNDANGDSDVDVVVRLDDAVQDSGFRYFGRIVELEERLRNILGVQVDVVTEPVRKDRLRRAIERDRVVAF